MASSTALKYARALAEVAADLQREDQTGEELSRFRDLLRQHEQLRETLQNPALPFAAKRKIVEEVASGVQLHQIVSNFILVLLEHGRIHQIDNLTEAFQDVLDERRGILKGEVFSSTDLSADVKKRLQDSAAEVLGKQVRLSYHLDESLIGGLKMKVGSIVFDGSIRTQLDQIRRQIAG
ncbi:MAG: ATP synthase F1 subunit delta [Acidobacteriota bacterium]